MASHAERAEELFRSGYNCAQSVFGAFADEHGLDFETSIRLASSFGGGMGRLREVCGALTGLFMVVSLQSGYTDPEDLEAKTANYQRVQELASKFRERYGTIICRDLLDLEETVSEPIPEKRTEEYYLKRSCAEYVRFAASLLDAQADTILKPEK